MAKKTLYDEDGNPVEVDYPDTNESDNGPAELRKALKKEKTERENLDKELATLRAESKARTVKDVLDKKGVPDKVAKFIPADVVTSEQIDEWLTANADVFNLTVVQSGANTETNNENANNQKRINNATESAISATKEADIMAKLLNPNTPDAELKALLNSDEPLAVGRTRR